MPKFTITGETLEEVMLSVAELLLKQGDVRVMDNKAKTSKYALYRLDDGLNKGEYDAGLNLEAEQAKTLAIAGHGWPMKLGVTFAFTQLTNPSQFASRIGEKKAATLSSVEKLEAQLAAARKRAANLSK